MSETCDFAVAVSIANSFTDLSEARAAFNRRNLKEYFDSSKNDNLILKY